MCVWLQISEQFRELSQKMYERPNCIEDLTEQREFVKTVPDLIQANQARIDQVHYHHSLHSFLLCLSFSGKSLAVAFPPLFR